MKIDALLSTIALLSGVSASTTTFSTKVRINAVTSTCTSISPVAETQLHRAIQTASDVLVQTRQRQNRLVDEEPTSQADQKIATVLGGSVEAVTKRVDELCPLGVVTTNPKSSNLRGGTMRSSIAATAEVRKIVGSGDPANRIDVVFMGDGYTVDERTRFFEDIERLTNDMFSGETFAQYLPLFNIWAAYVPSAESGIGINSAPRKTAFQLYREAGILRAIYANDEKAAQDLCDSLGPGGCDFASIIANDEYYGGLGGNFIISTRSKASGTVVLRHEMGHNFGVVGEEYDGAYYYTGANSAKSVENVTWKHWLTDPTRLREERVTQAFHSYMWHDFSEGPYVIKFNSTGTLQRWGIQFSLTGIDSDDMLSVTLDGQPLPFKSKGLVDRSFYSWTNSTSGFSAGTHQLVFQASRTLNGTVSSTLCNAGVYEFADENDFKMDDRDFIGIFPTFDGTKAKLYRPDNERCLMRNVTSTSFCRVCQENMWHKFLARVEFIDAVVVDGRKVSLQLIPLGQLRLPTDTFVQTHPAVAAAEKYSTQWLRDGQELVALRDALDADLSGQPAGNYTVRVAFSTPNVRQDPNGYMVSQKNFTVV